MNRRRILALSIAASLAPSAGWSAEGLLVSHVIRLGFAPGVTGEVRAAHIRTFNRFKQTRGPRLVIVGRDVSADGAFEFAQITTFADEAGYREYFYDPIHLAADREAETLKAISRGASFDIFPRYVAAEAARLQAINAGRAARFKANDDRPTAPPVADRPQDQVWRFGGAFFYVLRVGFGAGDPASQRAAFQALVQQAGSRAVVSGQESGAPSPAQTGHAMVVKFASERDWDDFAASRAMHTARDSGLFAPGRHLAFFVIDPAADALAQKLKTALSM